MTAAAHLARASAGIAAGALACAVALEARADETNSFIDARGGLMVADSRRAPGQTEGTFATFAYGVDAGVRARRGPHVFSGAVHLLAGLSFTLVSPDVAKGVDDARAGASYEFALSPWFSLSAWGRGETALFASRTLRGADTAFRVARADGLVERVRAPSLDLTSPFAPFMVHEGLGPTLHPLAREVLSIDVAAGLGGEHVFASGQLAVDDSPHTREVEVVELESYHALTPLVSVACAGELEGRLSYAADVEVRFPVVHTDTRAAGDASIGELTEIGARHTLRFALLPWLTVDYELSIGRTPMLLSGVRIENRLMLSAHPFAVEPTPR
jgi:hypothetical protein